MINNQGLENLKKISVLLDSKFTGPFGFKFGLDGILGLIPFLGDFITTSMSLYILAQAAALGCSPSVLIRMGGNILIENLADLIPVVGTFFDFVWKANNRNMQLLEKHLESPKGATFESQVVLGLIGVTLMAFLLSSLYLTVFIFEKIFSWIALFTS